MIDKLYEKVMNNEFITHEEALFISNAPLDKLTLYADNIRKKFCQNIFDVCSIINAKSGKCSEDCKFCAQSAHYKTDISEYPLIDKEKIISEALSMAEKGVLRFSIVTSGKSLTDKEVDIVCDTISEIKSKCSISICASLGLLSDENFRKLKNAGLERVHNNLEASKNYFPQVCSTHSFEDKIMAIKIAQKHGFSICSGMILGLGETMEDRIDLSFTLKDLGIKSIPVNILNPIKGTPYENNKPLTYDEVLRTCAVIRFIMPEAFIRLAGGRLLLDDKGEKAFLSGVNAVITGDMLTTAGISVNTDMQMIHNAGYNVELANA